MEQPLDRRTRIIILILGSCILALILAFFFLEKRTRNYFPSNAPIEPTPVVCSQDVKECPDGSFVSRVAPNCEFSSCPEIDSRRNNRPGELVGNDRDEHGCIGSAGYIWCEAKQKCLRTFEETCADSSLDENWQLYRNDRLGFEIKLPKAVNLWTDEGAVKTHPVKTLENDNIVWFTPEGSPDYVERAKIITGNQPEFEKVQGIPWAILLKKASNDAELENFIQQRYGHECRLGEKKTTNQTGVFDVSIKTSEGEEPGEGCFLNWALVIKYAPEKGLVVAWDLGQATTFNTIDSKGNLLQSFDQEMTESFKFIK